MTEGVDLEVFRGIPGYKGILKAVLKSQIQLLLHQLAQLAGEETVLLSASVADGTFGHLGSDFGKDFIRGHDDYKAKFLGFCMEKHHKRKSGEKPQSLVERFASHVQRSKARSGYRMSPKHSGSLTSSPRVPARVQMLISGSKSQKRQASHMLEDPTFSEVDLKRERTLDESGAVTPNGRSGVGQSGVPLYRDGDPAESPGFTKVIKQEVADAEGQNASDETEGPGEGWNKEGGDIGAMRDEEQQSGSFDYVLDQGREERESPLSWQPNGTYAAERAPTSKRKQFVPIRHVQTGSGDENVDLSDSVNPTLGASGAKENVSVKVERVSPVTLGGVAKVNVNWTNESFSIAGEENYKPLSESSDLYGSNYYGGTPKQYPIASYSEDSIDMKPVHRTPPIDGLLVSRGEGRYEKLIKCDTCGKVCRTSNMARHKKRYCTGCPKDGASPNNYRPELAETRTNFLPAEYNQENVYNTSVFPNLEFEGPKDRASPINYRSEPTDTRANFPATEYNQENVYNTPMFPKSQFESDDFGSTGSL